jgi:hypothetical protein
MLSKSQKRTRAMAQLSPPRAQTVDKGLTTVTPNQTTLQLHSHDNPSSNAGTPLFHFRGIHSSDTPREAEARRRQVAIRREHRAARRAGEQPSPTPALSRLLHEESSPTPPGSLMPNGYIDLPSTPSPMVRQSLSRGSTPPLRSSLRSYRGRGSSSSSRSSTPRPSAPVMSTFFLCSACGIARDIQRQIHTGVDSCVYCRDDETFAYERKYCIPGRHEVIRVSFCDPNGEEWTACNACRLRNSAVLREQQNLADEQGPHRTPSRQNEALGDNPPTNHAVSAHTPMLDHYLQASDPPMNLDGFTLLSDPALTPRDWDYLQCFHDALDKLQLEICGRCNERWFDMKINQEGVCTRCMNVDQNQDTPLYGAVNKMDPSSLPNLPN